MLIHCPSGNTTFVLNLSGVLGGKGRERLFGGKYQANTVVRSTTEKYRYLARVSPTKHIAYTSSLHPLLPTLPPPFNLPHPRRSIRVLADATDLTTADKTCYCHALIIGGLGAKLCRTKQHHSCAVVSIRYLQRASSMRPVVFQLVDAEVNSVQR